MVEDDVNFDLSRRKALAALGTIGAAGAGAGYGTSALFRDQETFANNSLAAGKLDMTVAYSAHYSDWSADEDAGVETRMWGGPAGTTGSPGDLADSETGLPTNEEWLIAVDDPDQFLANTRYMADGNASCDAGTNADELEQPVIELDDIKPGDFGEVTFDFALCDNPGFVWLNGKLHSAAENGVTEPEGEDPAEDGDADSSDPPDVELLDAVQAAVWVDDGDNYQDGEVIVLSGSLRTVLGELQAGPGLALGGNVDSGDTLGRNCFSHDKAGSGTADAHSVSFAWWLPVDTGNEVQTDSVVFDLGLYTEQCRHNGGTAVDLDAVVASPEMQQLLTDLGHPSPADTSAEDFGSLGTVEFRFDQARTRRTQPDSPLEDQDGEQISTIYTTTVPSPVGTLQLVSTENELLVPPSFVFDEKVSESLKTELDVAGQIGWPGETKATVIGGEDSSTFVRDISGTERTDIEDAIEREVDSALGFNVDQEGIYVAPPTLEEIDTSQLGQNTPGSLVTDGGTAGKTFILGPGFGVKTSYSINQLISSSSGPLVQCAQSINSCLAFSLGQSAAFVMPALLACVLIGRAINKGFQDGLVGTAIGLSPLLDTPAYLFIGVCPIIILLVTGFATLAFIIAKCLTNPCLLSGQQPGPIEVPLNPKGTFLRANGENPPPPAIIDLNEVGLSPDDKITIKQFGDTTSQPGGPEKRHSTIAVFSGSDTLLGPSNKNRVPDAIDAGPDAETPNTFFGNQSTNIPEDFRVADFDGSDSSVTVTIPSGATHLFIGIEDSFATDNTDPDNDYRVTITPQ